jgi:hypothetical protein
MLNFKSLPVVLGVLAAVVWVSPSKASIVQALDLDELVAQADQILLGRVVFSESFQRPNGTIGTWHRIQIERDVRGSAADEREVMVETLGGSLGDVAMRVEGEPTFAVGERVLVFVRGDGAYQAFRPVGMGQGVMRVRTEEGVDRVRQTGAGMLLMRRNAQGVLEKSRGALPHEERLETFLSRVRRILDRKPSGTDE